MKRNGLGNVQMNRGKQRKTQTYFEQLFEQELENDLLQIEKTYLEDSFNAYGLYDDEDHKERMLFRSLSHPSEKDKNELQTMTDFGDESERKEINKRLKDLYGQIHARYLLTNEGCIKAYKCWREAKWGKCTQKDCGSFHLLPYGKTYQLNQCVCIYYCGFCGRFYGKQSNSIDGAYFGNWFINYFFLEYPSLRMNSIKRKKCKKEILFGFEIASEKEQKEMKENRNEIQINAPLRRFINYNEMSDETSYESENQMIEVVTNNDNNNNNINTNFNTTENDFMSTFIEEENEEN